jgi:hypothetical protein
MNRIALEGARLSRNLLIYNGIEIVASALKIDFPVRPLNEG